MQWLKETTVIEKQFSPDSQDSWEGWTTVKKSQASKRQGGPASPISSQSSGKYVTLRFNGYFTIRVITAVLQMLLSSVMHTAEPL